MSSWNPSQSRSLNPWSVNDTYSRSDTLADTVDDKLLPWINKHPVCLRLFVWWHPGTKGGGGGCWSGRLPGASHSSVCDSSWWLRAGIGYGGLVSYHMRGITYPRQANCQLLRESGVNANMRSTGAGERTIIIPMAGHRPRTCTAGPTWLTLKGERGLLLWQLSMRKRHRRWVSLFVVNVT